MDVKKIMCLIQMIFLMLLLGGCSKHYRNKSPDDTVSSTSDDAVSSIGKKIFDSGATIVFAPNEKDLKNSSVISLLTGQVVKPCQEWDEVPEVLTGNECEVKIVEENGRTSVIKLDGREQKIIGSLNINVVHSFGSICWTFKNGAQYTECYEEADVKAWCNIPANSTHDICDSV